MDTAIFTRIAPPQKLRQIAWLALALGASAIAVALQVAIGPALDRAAFLLPFIAVCIGAWFGGAWCGILTGILGAVLIDLFVFPPLNQLSLATNEVVPLFGFLASSVVSSIVLGRLKGAAANLRRKEEELSDLVENANLGISWMGADGTILWANAAELALLGYPPEEYLGRSIREFHVDPPGEILASLNDGPGFVNREVRLRARDGSIKTALLDASVLRHDGRFVHARCFTRDITERKAAEKALQESEAKFRTLFEKSLDAIGVSRRGVHVFVNPGYLRLFGYEMPADLLGRPVLDVLAPASRAMVAERIERRARGETVPTQYEVRALDRKGHEFDAEVNVSTFDLNGSPHTLVIVRDVSERKKAERELSARARQQEIVAAFGQKALSGSLLSLYQHAVVMVQHTLDVSHVAYFDVLSGGRELRLRAGAGWPPEILGARLDASMRYHPGYVLSCKGPVIVRSFASEQRFAPPTLFVERGINSGVSISIQGKDSCFGVLSALHRAERDFGANEIHFLQAVAYILAAAVDRQNAEAALVERETLLRRVLDANPSIILVKDRDGAILLANEALSAGYGVALDQIVGHSHLELHRRLKMSAREVAQWLADDREVIDTGTPRDVVEPFTHRDGSAHWYTTRKLPLTLGADRKCVLIVSVDVTEQKKAADEVRKLNAELELRVRERTAELAEANRELEAFSYSVSHDLRAPLRAIGGFAHIIREEHHKQLDSEAAKLFDVICLNTQRMADLIDNLLRFSRLSRTELHRARIDMASLAQSVADDLKHLEPGRELRVAIGDLPEATGDPALVRQVLVNLISNAFKFTRRRHATADIEVGASRQEAGTIYFVRDNGVGFDTRYADKLFQVFHRLHRAEEFDGTGVGLAIVQRIVQRHGGRVWADGKVNQGATFYFTLPPPTPS